MLKRSLEKGTNVERLKITQRSAFLLGRKFDFRAKNSAIGPEFPPLDKISGGQKFLNFCPFEIWLSPLLCGVVQHSVKGPEILVLAKILGARNSIISAPAKFG
jgi:hypothetical protein